MSRLSGSVAVVTGAAGGIGRALVRRLAEDGARVVLVDVDEIGLQEMTRHLSSELLLMPIDITRTDQVQQMARRVESHWGRIDILVNNAGRTRIGPFIESREEHWEELFRVDVFGLLRCTQAVLPGMLSRQRGRIINIASDAARAGLAGQSVYAAAKGAVIAFTKSLAQEVAPHVLVNAVSPGPVNTPPLQRLFQRQPEFAAKLTAQIPFGRIAEPEEVAAVVAFLASEDASYLTGQVVSVNGGWIMA